MNAIVRSVPDDTSVPPALEPIAMVALDAGRMLMEAGASAKSIEAIVEKFARGLGADRVDLRIGYASLAITIGIGPNGITRMRKVGHLGVNQRVDLELWHLSDRVETKQLSVEQTRAELDRIGAKTKRHSAWVMAVAVGLACAGFGRLLKVDWAGTGPVFLAATIGQYLRRDLLARHANVFVSASVVAFVAALLGGVGAQWAGSATVMTAMIASILLLVPGIPSVNAQYDILEGHPTLGSARAVTVAVILIFLAAGLGSAQALIGASQDIFGSPVTWPLLYLLHQTVCGAIAAAGFGVLFNISFRSLGWCAVSGGLALAVRTYCQSKGWNLESSSFAAALTVSTFVLVLRSQTDISQNALDVVGCIPMVPGSFAAKAILGLFALTSTDTGHATETLTVAVQYTLRVMFTIGAIGTGLAIPTLMQRVRVSR
ncbi:MAG TPA: threonine/serine exporter family protein [Verrucomicrobiae bacterium]